jgi:hypothetical protein
VWNIVNGLLFVRQDDVLRFIDVQLVDIVLEVNIVMVSTFLFLRLTTLLPTTLYV